MPSHSRGKLVIVSGPSGAGKSTVLKHLLQCAPVSLVAAVSVTTRAPRKGEIDGVDYHFITTEQFSHHRERGELLECFEVFGRGHWYGTLKKEVTPSLEAGKWVLLEIDVQGAMAVLEQFPDAVTIFIHPGSLEELEKRLRGRGTESEASIQRRLARAQEELGLANRYEYQVVNDNVSRAVQVIRNILSKKEADHDAR